MYHTLPKPLVTCSKCGGIDIAIPERNANGPDVSNTLLRCRTCGHEKVSGDDRLPADTFYKKTGTISFPRTEKF